MFCTFFYPDFWDNILQEIIPIINWETTTFSTPVLAVLVVASVALFPTVLLPSSPSMWVAGMTFGYGYGFLLIMSGVAVGVSLPYFIGSLFYRKIQVRTSCKICPFHSLSLSACVHTHATGVEHFHVYWHLGHLVFVCLTFLDSYTGLVREVSKESFHSKISWWRKLVSSVSICSINQDFSFSLYHI